MMVSCLCIINGTVVGHRPTEERRLLADFSSAFYSDVLRLVVARRTEGDEWSNLKEMLEVPFRPFTSGYWLALLALLLFLGGALWAIEGWTNEEDFPFKACARGLFDGKVMFSGATFSAAAFSSSAVSSRSSAFAAPLTTSGIASSDSPSSNRISITDCRGPDTYCTRVTAPLYQTPSSKTISTRAPSM